MKSSILYNPFNRIAGFNSLIVGLIGFIIVTFLAFETGTHFIGLLSFDFAKDSDYWFFFTEHFSNWLLTSTFMYISGLILSKSKIRIIDVLGTTLLSRIPLIIVPLLRLLPFFQSFLDQSWQIYILMGFYLFSVIWTIALLFNSFKISCNLKNEKLITSFIVSLIASETITRLIIISLTFKT